MLPENETELSARTIHSTVQKLASRVSTWNTFAPVTQFRIHPEILAGCTKRKQPEKGETGREREFLKTINPTTNHEDESAGGQR